MDGARLTGGRSQLITGAVLYADRFRSQAATAADLL